MTGLTNHDVLWILRRLPKCVKDLMKQRRRTILAGGFIRSCIANEPIHDIDLFCESKDAAEVAAIKLAEKTGINLRGEPKTLHKIIHTDNAFTVLRNDCRPIQVIHRWTFSGAQDVVLSFDFTIARAALWNEKQQGRHVWRSISDDRFYADLAGKRLVYCQPIRNEDAGGSLLRVLKFYQRGYRIPLESMGAVIARLVAALEPRTDIANEHYVGLVLTGLLREVDPSIDPDHIAHLPGLTDEALADDEEVSPD